MMSLAGLNCVCARSRRYLSLRLAKFALLLLASQALLYFEEVWRIPRQKRPSFLLYSAEDLSWL